jgi:lipopolysaccharide heptosyltransferase II
LKILILKPSSLGDVVQALPVLRLLRIHFPTAEIYWWISSDLKSLLDGDPDLTGVFPFDRRRWSNPRHWTEALASIREMRRHRFDWVIDLQALARSGAVSWLVNGDRTIGLLDLREGASGFYDQAVPRRSYDTHAVDWYLDVLRALEVPVHWRFEWLPVRNSVREAIERQWPSGAFQWVILNPGARWLNKRWPTGHFASLVRQIARIFPQVRFTVIGSAADRELARVIVAGAPDRVFDLTGNTTLPEMIEWTRRSALVITNDTGPMHVAAALNIPLLGLFGPTTPSRTGPYRQIENVLTHPLPCAPCMTSECRHIRPLECLTGISPPTVLAKAAEILTKSSAPPHGLGAPASLPSFGDGL